MGPAELGEELPESREAMTSFASSQISAGWQGVNTRMGVSSVSNSTETGTVTPLFLHHSRSPLRVFLHSSSGTILHDVGKPS